eukprot:GHVR01022983.1.p1 GENE.GHVR01022983.1~~GHVR01022983.1.p1  ORF type:complete len:219 (-),score=48.65 GHVR01022983.1:534-1190(-)
MSDRRLPAYLTGGTINKPKLSLQPKQFGEEDVERGNLDDIYFPPSFLRLFDYMTCSIKDKWRILGRGATDGGLGFGTIIRPNGPRYHQEQYNKDTAVTFTRHNLTKQFLHYRSDMPDNVAEEHARPCKEIKDAFLAFQKEADQIYQRWKEKLGDMRESSVQAASFNLKKEAAQAAIVDKPAAKKESVATRCAYDKSSHFADTLNEEKRAASADAALCR